MGWFDEQLRERIQHDADAFSDAFDGLASVVMGETIARRLNDSRVQAQNALAAICQYYHVKPREAPDTMTDIHDQLEYQLRPTGIMRRAVCLQGAWYKDAVGAMLGTRADNHQPVALLPDRLRGGYSLWDTQTGKRLRVNAKTAALIEQEAICFYRPLPLRKVSVRDLLTFILHTLDASDFLLAGAGALAVTLVGMLLPMLNRLIYAHGIESGSVRLLLALFGFLCAATLSRGMLDAVRTLLVERMRCKLDVAVQAAGMMRLLSLPPAFFKRWSSGELSARLQYLNSLCALMVDTVLTAGLTSVFSLIYIGQMARYGAGLVWPGMLVILLTLLVSAATLIAQVRLTGKQMEAATAESGVAYALISGVQKIRLAGAERRAFARWARCYQALAKLEYDPPTLVRVAPVLTTCLSLMGTVVIYAFALKTGISLPNYYAFNSAYAMVTSAFMALLGAVGAIAQIHPILGMVRPLLEAVPEQAEEKQLVTRLSGGVELNNVSFRYTEDGPLILDNLSLKIRPGQYVAVVGATGCGKSTLMRLLLGFEKPQKGASYYDGKDLAKLDVKSLRRSVGTVMQDGKLFHDDIFANITISAPWLTLDDAWEAAELAGIAEDIRRMPMGMHTILTEGGGGISGGQRQRLMIARAVASKPRILMLDEATSALDNLTQKRVSDALASLKCTRIVIAHRLSTIRQCDRIVVLHKGRIVEDGTYDELVKQGGYFAELVARQRLDAPTTSA